MLQIPVPWKSVRYDAITHNFAKTYLEEFRPKLLYIAYDETDEYAHEGKYDQYLIAANQLDQYNLKEIHLYVFLKLYTLFSTYLRL